MGCWTEPRSLLLMAWRRERERGLLKAQRMVPLRVLPRVLPTEQLMAWLKVPQRSRRMERPMAQPRAPLKER